MELAGQRVLVTGASRGIGAALSDALEVEGAVVLRVATREQPPVLGCDVSDPEQVARLCERTGPVDVLINNAGVIHEPAPLLEIPLAEWRRLFDTNVFGMVAVLQAYLPAMNERRSGVVLNLSSTWGRVAVLHQSPYCATKFAVEALSSALAQETVSGVVVVAVNPGVVATDMLATCFEGATGAATPPEECAAAFVRMLGRLDPSWNGRSVDVDGF